MSLTTQPLYLSLPSRLSSIISSLHPSSPITPSQSDTIFSRSVQLLPLLNNPLNIELLARHILQSPAVWTPAGRSPQRYSRILAGFRASLRWKVTDLEEGKGGVDIDEWILAIGRGAIGDAPAWRHLLLFAGLRSAITEEIVVQKKTIKALEHAYVRALSRGLGDTTDDISEATLYTFALMEHMNPDIVDQVIASAKPERLLVFLADAIYSPTIGFFHEIPMVLSTVGTLQDSVGMAHDLESHILQSYIPRIANFISRSFAAVREPAALILSIDRIRIMVSSIKQAFSSLPNPVAESLLQTEPSLTVKTDVNSIIRENLQRVLFATVMSLQGVITNLMHSRNFDYADISLRILDVLRQLAFISTRFGYASFDQWNFVYLASIDLLSSNPSQAVSFVQNYNPNSQPQHPSSRSDTLFFLDTLEHFIPILPQPEVNALIPFINTFLQLPTDVALRPHLESAHSVFLAILARGDLLQNHIPTYINQIYSTYPSALTSRQVRLAFSTIIKLSSSLQSNEILTNLLQYAQRTVEVDTAYFLALVDCLPWIEAELVEFWLEQIAFGLRGVSSGRREEIVKRIWDIVSGEMGGEAGMIAAAWWVNGGHNRVLNPKL